MELDNDGGNRDFQKITLNNSDICHEIQINSEIVGHVNQKMENKYNGNFDDSISDTLDSCDQSNISVDYRKNKIYSYIMKNHTEKDLIDEEFDNIQRKFIFSADDNKLLFIENFIDNFVLYNIKLLNNNFSQLKIMFEVDGSLNISGYN